MSGDAIGFLTTADALAIHAQQLERFGGSDGVREQGLLDSGVAQAQASFGGQLMHSDVIAMAGAYWFHIVRNHAFVDGNKRTGLLACLVFLRRHGWSLDHVSPALYEVTLALADGKLSKEHLTDWLRLHAKPR